MKKTEIDATAKTVGDVLKERANMPKTDMAVKEGAKQAAKWIIAASKKAEKEAKKNRVPDLVEQLDDRGRPEQVDRNVFKFEVKCAHPGCTEIRYVTLSGLREVTMCKPHARKTRRVRRVEKKKGQVKQYKAIVEAALKLGLFPQTFMEDHGLV